MGTWEKVPDNGNRIRWDTPGMKISGILISLEQVDATYGKVWEATMQIDGQIKQFYAPKDLASKLAVVPINSETYIVYTDNVKTGMGMMKKFNVAYRTPEEKLPPRNEVKKNSCNG